MTSAVEADLRDYVLEQCVATIRRRRLKSEEVARFVNGGSRRYLMSGDYSRFSVKSALNIADHLGIAEKLVVEFADALRTARAA